MPLRFFYKRKLGVCMSVTSTIKRVSNFKNASVKVIEENTKSVKGTFKNAKTITTLVLADPLTKVLIFLALVVITFLFSQYVLLHLLFY